MGELTRSIRNMLGALVGKGPIRPDEGMGGGRAEHCQAGSPGSWDDPIRCHDPAGEHEYLSRLRGPDGRPVLFERFGNAGTGKNGNIVDQYLVQSRDKSVVRWVYMDMYCRGYRETRPVDGFSITD